MFWRGKTTFRSGSVTVLKCWDGHTGKIRRLCNEKQVGLFQKQIMFPKTKSIFWIQEGVKKFVISKGTEFSITSTCPLVLVCDEVHEKNWPKNLPTPFISLIPLSILSSGGDGGLLHFPRLIISFLLLRGRRYFRVIYFLYSRKNCTTAIIFASPDHLIAIILRRPHHLIIFENNLCLSWSPDCDYLIPVIWNSIMIFVSIIILASPSIWHLFWISKISLLLWQKGHRRKLISKVLKLIHK